MEKDSETETLRVAGFLPCSLVNGDGVRFVVFVQGCNHRCAGCQNPDTWDFYAGECIEIPMIADRINRLHSRGLIDGVTLSGGDPFYQQEACCELLKQLSGINVWCYTGFHYDEIKDTELAQLCDVIVDGPFVEALKCTGQPFGSSNQKIYRKDSSK